MQKSRIEWTDFTWNPITGCTNGCSYCYARRMASNPFYKKAFPHGFIPTFYPERLKDLNKKSIVSKKVFVCSMGELFGDNPDWTRDILFAIQNHPHTIFQLLTKQPENLAKWNFPPNAWVGTSVDNKYRLEPAIKYLKEVDAVIKFISFEPLLGDINDDKSEWYYLPNIDWVIIGARTQPLKLPNIKWVQNIISVANIKGIPVFLKDNLQSLFPGEKLKQEMPKCR